MRSAVWEGEARGDSATGGRARAGCGTRTGRGAARRGRRGRQRAGPAGAGHRLRAHLRPGRGVHVDHACRRPGRRHRGERDRGAARHRSTADGSTADGSTACGRLPGPRAPAEAWAHLALYRARPDAAAIARAQPAAAFAVAAVVTMMVPLHGQAAWLGESVPVHDDAALLRSPDQAERAARCLPDGEALLLRGNGALTLGAAPRARGGQDVAARRRLRRLPGGPGRVRGQPCHPAVGRRDRVMARCRRRTAPPALAAPARRAGFWRTGAGRKTALGQHRPPSASTSSTGYATGPARRT